MNLSNAARSSLSKIPGLNKAIDVICARANEVFGVQHDNETGAHTNITATSIVLAPPNGTTDLANFSGSIVPLNATDELGYDYPATADGNAGPQRPWLKVHVTTLVFEVFRNAVAVRATNPSMTASAFANNRNNLPFTWTMEDTTGANTHTLTIGAGLNGLTSNNLITGNSILATPGDVTSLLGYLERSRSVYMGEWTTYTPTLTAATGTWTGATLTTAAYMLVGKTLFINFAIDAANNSNATASLSFSLPGGFTNAKLATNPINLLDLGVAVTDGMADALAAATTVRITRTGGVTIGPNAANGLYVRGQVALEIQ